MAWPAKNRLGNKGVSLTAGHPGKLSKEVNNNNNNKAKTSCTHSFLREKRKGKGEGELRGKVPSLFFCFLPLNMFKLVLLVDWFFRSSEGKVGSLSILYLRVFFHSHT